MPFGCGLNRAKDAAKLRIQLDKVAYAARMRHLEVLRGGGKVCDL